MDYSEDDRIVVRVLDGDINAFARLVDKYERPVYNLMYRMTRCPHTSADLTQDTFIAAYSRLHRFQRGRKFFTWLYTIGLNIARDALRRQRVREGACSPDLLFENVQAAPRNGDPALGACSQDLLALNQVMMRLPVNYRETVILRYREGMALEEIAGIFGLSVSGVKMRLHRALQMMREMLGEAPA